MANGLTLDEVLARVVLEGDSDFALSDGCSTSRGRSRGGGGGGPGGLDPPFM